MKKIKLVDKILEHSGDSILVISKDGVILSANPEALDLLEFSEEELVGKSYYWFFFNQTPNQKLGELINDGFHKSVEHFLEEASYSTPSGLVKKVKISTALLAEQPSGPAFHPKESLVVFIKRVDKGRAAKSTDEDRRDTIMVNRLKRELEETKKQNDQFNVLLNRFDLVKTLIAGLVFIIFGFALVFSKNSIQLFPRKSVRQPVQGVEGKIVTATLDSLTMGIELSGMIEPYNKVTIAAQTSGKVVRRNFNEGDYVQKGAILYQMDTKDLAKNVRSARVAYIELLEKYNQLAGWDSSLVVMQAKRKFELSKIALKNERKKLQETKKLFEKGIIPRVEYEQAMTAYKKAEYDYENAQQSLETEMDKGSQDKMQVLRLKLDNAKEELDEVEARYEATLIRAPVSGIVMRPELKSGRFSDFKNEGDMVNDGDLVATIGATESYIINSAIGELSVKKIKVGQKVVISGPGFRNIKLEGKVDWIASTATVEGNFRFFPVRISFSDVPDSVSKQIRLGMYAEMSIHTQDLKNVVTIPIEAVSYSDGKDKVIVVNEDGEYEERPVITGYSDRGKIVIKEGLKPGEKVVIGSMEKS